MRWAEHHRLWLASRRRRPPHDGPEVGRWVLLAALCFAAACWLAYKQWTTTDYAPEREEVTDALR